MTGTWLGYTWGCVGFWKQSKTKLLTCARRYPDIFAHALLVEFDIEVPKQYQAKSNDEGDVSLEQWILTGGIKRLSYSILAAQSCEEDVFEMQKNERQKLIDKYSEQENK